ncbi:CCA tRNA nucleotidyltransferase [Thermosulfurimonas sp. F29]|uniref:CCA tRNA nucleotidyltransferase n=1 Tax=Thermosulfurimonas sp. F29 TaxID=2867247 RepID=UPI001C83C15C|nr:HD domain-containing protein [Thermosulfurimonas sp. F29]MBX6421992.1 HD domain-containing protein [Thermosulfurimonas sp. F29]
MGDGYRGQTGGLLSGLALKESSAKIRDFLQELAGRGEVYVTGGAVRDILRGERVGDLDLTVVDLSPLEVAEEAARRLSWALVPLHEDFGVFRVAHGGFSLDISGLRPGAVDIEEDLRLRDFTFNALAVPLPEALEKTPSEWPLLDPCLGLRDLKSGLIRAISRRNLVDDPLRILRAYRFYALGFGEIEEETRRWLSAERERLLGVARERIAHELMLILKSKRAGETFSLMAEDEVFFVIFPELAEARGVPQPAFHHLDVLGHSLEALRRAEEVLEAPEKFFGTGEPFREVLKDPERVVAVKLAALFHDAGKARTFAPPGKRSDRITFYEHEKVGAEMFEAWATRLRWKRSLAKKVQTLIRHHMRPFFLLELYLEGRLTVRARRRLIRDCPDYPLLFLLALADALAARGPASEKDTPDKLVELFEDLHRFAREIVSRVERERLVTGHDLIEIFGLKPGPVFREILSALEEARMEGRVKDRAGALAWIREYLKGRLPKEGV